MSRLGTFPFGQPIVPVSQRDRGPKRAFVLGVYASAVHARWIGPDNRPRIAAVAVASEPEIFWRGDNAEDIVDRVAVPPGAGRLEPASPNLNGPSGAALDVRFLHPLGLFRDRAWLCDLVPHSCMNDKQRQAIEQRYLPVMKTLGLPQPNWPPLPACLANEQRRSEIEAELQESQASILITLGDQPLRWFTARFGSKAGLAAYGETAAEYGRFHPIQMGGHQMLLLPLVHPRQAAKLGSHSGKWAELHERWSIVAGRAKSASSVQVKTSHWTKPLRGRQLRHSVGTSVSSI